MQPFMTSSVYARQGRVAGSLIQGLCASALGHQQPALLPFSPVHGCGKRPVSESPRTCPLGSSGSFWHWLGSVGVWLCYKFIISFLPLPNTSHCPKADHLTKTQAETSQVRTQSVPRVFLESAIALWDALPQNDPPPKSRGNAVQRTPPPIPSLLWRSCGGSVWSSPGCKGRVRETVRLKLATTQREGAPK